MILTWAGVLVAAYLLGAIPTGFIAVKRLRGVDVRELGSGSSGATNVLRTLGVKAGLAVFLIDLGKGAATAALGQVVLDAPLAAVAAGLSGMIGHNWPVYLRFRGGRGVTPFFGAMLVLSWPVALMGGAVVFSIIGLTRYVSLGSLLGTLATAAIFALLLTWGRAPVELLAYAAAGGLLILFQHRGNIGRLLTGRERKLGQSPRAPSPQRGGEG